MDDSDAGKLTRRDALRRIGTMAAGAALAPTVGGLGFALPKEDGRRPNVVLLVVDDLGYGDLGCYGSKAIDTPHLDRLAKQGVRLTHYYVAVPLCAPTRVSFMTGKYPQRTSLPHNPNWKDPDDGLSPDEVTTAEVLRDAGYHTGLVGKWHLGYSERFRPLKQGFQEYYGFLSGWADFYEHTYRDGSKWMFKNEEAFDEPGYMTDLLTREAIAYLDRHKEEPFFLYVAYNAPHWPHQAPEEWMKRAKTGAYEAMVECLDDSIGQVVRHLDDLGLADNTLAFFMSDNGSDGSGSNEPMTGGKGNLHEGGIRVPAIARWPGKIPAGKEIAEPIISMDLFTTFAKAGRAKLPEELIVDGKDVLPVLAGKAKSPHELLFWQHKGQTAVRRGDLKLLRGAGKRDGLYNVVDDPGEKNDLSEKNPGAVVELSAARDRWLGSLKNQP
jgi:arylsulfatase A-like enzyme